MKVSEKTLAHICETCPKKKAKTKAIHTTPIPKPDTSFSIVCSDLSGRIAAPSIGGCHHFTVLIDAKSRFGFVYLSSAKSDLPTILDEHCEFVLTQFGTKIQRIHSDRGDEYTSKTVQAIMKCRGINHTMTAAHTLAHNGIAERRIGLIGNLARCMLLHTHLPVMFWNEAVVYANCIINCVSTNIHRDEDFISLYESLFCRKPNISNLRTFDCRAQMMVKDSHFTKFQARTKEVIYLRPSQDSTGHRLWDPITKKVSMSRDVTFFEDTFSPLMNYTENPFASIIQEYDSDDSDQDSDSDEEALVCHSV
jgi:transposase InsO family protein